MDDEIIQVGDMIAVRYGTFPILGVALAEVEVKSADGKWLPAYKVVPFPSHEKETIFLKADAEPFGSSRHSVLAGILDPAIFHGEVMVLNRDYVRLIRQLESDPNCEDIDSDMNRREQAYTQLLAKGQAALREIRWGCVWTPDDSRLWCIRALGALKDTDAQTLEVLSECLGDSSIEIRRAAIEVLQTIGTPLALELIARFQTLK